MQHNPAKYTVFRFYNRAGATDADQPALCQGFPGGRGRARGRVVADLQNKMEARNTRQVTDL